MDLQLAGKVALVTGGSRGIGAAICRGLAEEGVKVGVNYSRSGDEAEAVVADIVAAGGQAVALQADLKNTETIPPLFDALTAEYGAVDLLVNNAAHCPQGPVTSYSAEDWEYTFGVNVTGAFVACREFVTRRQAAGSGGKIINIVSQAAFRGSTSGRLPYDASKGALVTLTLALAREVAPLGINVNAVAPGLVRTEMIAPVLDADPEKYRARVPLNRIAEPREIADVVVFLASTAAGYLTGTTLDVTGGMLMR